jgi:hypothetical protein
LVLAKLLILRGFARRRQTGRHADRHRIPRGTLILGVFAPAGTTST